MDKRCQGGCLKGLLEIAQDPELFAQFSKRVTYCIALVFVGVVVMLLIQLAARN